MKQPLRLAKAVSRATVKSWAAVSGRKGEFYTLQLQQVPSNVYPFHYPKGGF